MIIVAGASGRIGSELVTLLSQRGVAVRALSRRVVREMRPGVEWLAVDLADRSRLAAAFSGADRLFLLTGNSEEMVRLQKNAIEVAQSAGVERIVKLSAIGASDHSKSVIGLWHYNIERVLKDSSLSWTIMRPHHFMDNLIEQRETIVRDAVVRSASGDGRIPFIDTRDIAEVAATVLIEPGHEGKTYSLTGPEALSYREATAALSRAIGKPLTYVAETEDETWGRLRRAGEPAWRITALLAIAEYQRAGGPTAQLTSTVRDLIGREPRRFEQFTRDRAAAFTLSEAAPDSSAS